MSIKLIKREDYGTDRLDDRGSICFSELYSVSLCRFVYCLSVNVYCTADTGFQPNFSHQIFLYLYTLVAGLLAKSQYPEGPANGHLGTDFLGFPASISKC